jgi:sugar lactone lactonase YvrE
MGVGPSQEGFNTMAPNPNGIGSAPIPCAPGRFSLAGSTTCGECPPGTYTPYQGSPSCLYCPQGTYSPNPGATACIACMSPYVCPGPPAGSLYYTSGSSLLQGSAGQITCPAGTRRNGVIGCTACAAGTYCPLGATQEIECPAGFYCPAATGTPIPCTEGNFCPLRAAAPQACTRAGFYCPAGSSGGSGSSGSTRAGTSFSNQYPCRGGYYCPGTGLAIACPAGKYGTSLGQISVSSCYSCPSRTYSLAGAMRCTACPFRVTTLSDPSISYPIAIAIDKTGRLYIADGTTNRIIMYMLMFNPFPLNGNFYPFAGLGRGLTDGALSTGTFQKPSGMAIDSTNTSIYVADSGLNAIRRANATTTQLTSITPILGSIMVNPTGVAITAQNLIYVTDTDNNRILRVTNGTASPFVGSATNIAGSANGTGSAATFNRPTGIVVDSTGNLYVADTGNHQIRRITPAGVVTTFAGSTAGYVNAVGVAAKFTSPQGIAIDSMNVLYIADTGNNLIRKILTGGTVSTLAGIIAGGYTDGPSATAAFNAPQGIAVDPSGYVYVADTGNGVVRIIPQICNSATGYVGDSDVF